MSIPRRCLTPTAILLALASAILSSHAADEVVAVPPPTHISASNFIHAETLPWQTVCEWTDADGKFRNSWTDGLGRPSEKTAPTAALCAAIRRFTFPSGRGFLEAHFQQAHPTPVQVDKSTNLMYVANGHAHHEVDGKTMDSGPGDVFVQAAGRPHQTTALSTDCVQIGLSLPDVGPGEGLKISGAELARGNLIHHQDAPKSDVCFINTANGAPKVVVRTAETSAGIPPDASCFTVYALVSRPGGSLVEVVAKKGSKTTPHREDMDTVIYYVKGRVRATIDGEVQEMSAGDSIFHPAGGLHADEFLEDSVQIEYKLAKNTKAP